MKIQFKNLAIASVAFAIGIGFNSMAISSITSNVAIIDVQKVVAASPEVQKLKTDRQAKIEDLQKWIATAKADVDKQSTESGKEKLAKKYDADLVKKQQALQKDYADKLTAIDKKITEIIQKESKAKGYALVLSKNAVLFGGTDITSEITKAVK